MIARKSPFIEKLWIKTSTAIATLWMDVIGYILGHWRGEFNLAMAFWVNNVLISACIYYVGSLYNAEQLISPSHPLGQLRGETAIQLFTYLIAPWQLVGLWRSATRHIQQTARTFWARCAKVAVVVTVVFSLPFLAVRIPVYLEVFQLTLGIHELDDFEVILNEDETMIRINGYIGFGITDRIRPLLAQNKGVTGLVLDSPGGWSGEGEELARVVQAYELDTYSLLGCSSSCTLPFVAGKNRSLAPGANLGFHQATALGYGSEFLGITLVSHEREERLFHSRGIDTGFISRMFEAGPEDMWYPTSEELIAANVVHSIRSAAEFWPTDYKVFSKTELENKVLSMFPVMAKIGTYETAFYDALLDEVFALVTRGASSTEIQHIALKRMEALTGRVVPLSSDDAVVNYVEEEVRLMEKLEQVEPYLSLKYLQPDRYGPVDLELALTTEEMHAFATALSQVVIDRHEQSTPDLDELEAVVILSEVYEKLEAEFEFLESEPAINFETYFRASQAHIRFFKTILAYDQPVAANVIKYIYASNQTDTSTASVGDDAARTVPIWSPGEE